MMHGQKNIKLVII